MKNEPPKTITHSTTYTFYEGNEKLTHQTEPCEYVRADIVEAMQAQLEAMAEALDKCRKYQVCDELDKIIDPVMTAYNEFMKGVQDDQ
jgi:hypothetical protein